MIKNIKFQIKVFFKLLELHILLDDCLELVNHEKMLAQIKENTGELKKLWKINKKLVISFYNKIRADYNKEDINKHFILGED